MTDVAGRDECPEIGVRYRAGGEVTHPVRTCLAKLTSTGIP